MAWPSVAILSLLLLRGPLLGLAPFVKKLSFRGLELEFRERVEQLQEQTASSPTVISGPVAVPEAILRLAEVSPRAAVLESWLKLEVALVAKARILGWEPFRAIGQDLNGAVQFLQKSEAITPDAAGAIQELRHLRNQAVHAPAFSPQVSDARAFVLTVFQLLQLLPR